MRTVTCEIGGAGRIVLTGTVFADKDRAKGVGGGRWDREDKCWTFPLTWETCKALRSQFKLRLEIGPKLRRWATEEKKRIVNVKEIGAAPDADLKVIPRMFPEIDRAMASRPYQRSGVAFMSELRVAGNLDEVGLGKTLTALASIVEAGSWRGTHLVIAPKTAVESVWGEEIRRWFASDMLDIGLFTMPEGKENRRRVLDEFLASASPTRILVLNKEMLRIAKAPYCNKCKMWETEITDIEHVMDGHRVVSKVRKCDWPELFDVRWSSVIIDEVHKVLSTGLKSATRKSQVAEGVTSLKFAPDALRFMLTGTPFRGKERNLWGLLDWLDPKRFSSKWRFIDSFFDVEDNGYGKVIGELRPERLADFNELLDRYFLRRTRLDVRADIPVKSRVKHWVKLTGEHRRQYDEFKKMGFAKLEGGTVESLGMLSELTRLRQLSYGCWDVMPVKKNVKMLAGKAIELPSGAPVQLIPTNRSPKLDLLIKLLEERGVTGKKDTEFKLEGGFKYVVASQFTQIVDSVGAELEKIGIKTLKITGKVTGGRRNEVVSSFQNDPNGPRVLLLNTIAGGESITLDRFCDEMFILDETWISDDQTQLEGRIDNRGQDRLAPRQFHYIRTRDTVEEGIEKLNEDQEDIQVTLLDRRRGAQIAKDLMR